MTAQENQLPELVCKRCGHHWVPRTAITRICPKCKSAYWDTDRVRKRRKLEGEGSDGDKS